MTRGRPKVSQRRRQNAAWRGRLSERLAELWLRLKGYRILGRNLRTPVGEIDLLARTGNTLVICEVKHRPTLDQALHAVTPNQQARLARATEYVLARPNRHIEGVTGTRFDLIAIVKGHLPQHIKNAWRS